MPKVGGLIPVEEILPDEEGDYLVKLENGDIFNASFEFIDEQGEFGCWLDEYGEIFISDKYWNRIENIIAWMPLPKPYEKESD